MGGNIVINTNSQGQPVEILAMDTADITTAGKILKIDKNGISVSSAGYSGAFSLLLDMDGMFDAAFLRGILDMALEKKGTLSDRQGNISWNMVTGAFSGKKVAAEKLSSGDGYSGSYHVDGATVTVREGIITAVTPDPAIEPDPEDPDPEEEAPGGEEGGNS